MHDPCTVAHDVPNPFHWHRDIFRKDYKPKWWERWRMKTLITIWHVDPETDGSDDSCGYCTPNLTEQDKKIEKEILDWDEKFPYFHATPEMTREVKDYSFRRMQPGECLALTIAAWSEIAWKRDRRRELSNREWSAIASVALTPHDNIQSTLCPEGSRKDATHFIRCVFNAYLRCHRKWWQHPRWHIHHWKLQIHPLQSLRRWLFTRCTHCGRRYPWGYCPVSTSWSEPKRKWYEGEKNTYHHDCPTNKVQALPRKNEA